jgi:hypothetical protein
LHLGARLAPVFFFCSRGDGRDGEWQRTSVVELGDGAEAFLAGRVPYLQPDNGRSVNVDDPLCQEGGADGGLGSGRREGVLDVAVDKRRLAHALAAEDHDLGLEAVGHGGLARRGRGRGRRWDKAGRWVNGGRRAGPGDASEGAVLAGAGQVAWRAERVWSSTKAAGQSQMTYLRRVQQAARSVWRLRAWSWPTEPCDGRGWPI